METQVFLSKTDKEASNSGLHHRANLLFLLISGLSILIAIRPANSSAGKLSAWLDPSIMMILAQIGLILIPTLLFVWLTRQPIRAALKLHSLSFGTGAKCLLAGLLCWPVFSTLSNLSRFGLGIISSASAQDPSIPAASSGSPWLAFIAITLVAPAFEEVLFRGTLLSAYESKFARHAIWLVAILFAIFHFDAERLLGALFAGLVAGWLVYRTRSIWAGVLVHLGINLIEGLLILFFSLAVPAGAGNAVQDATVQVGDPMAQLLMGILVWGGIGLVLLIPTFFLLKNIGKRYPDPASNENQINLSSLWSYSILIFGACVYFITQLLR